MGYVYKITNTANGKAYIGISIHEPEKRRIKEHLSGRGNRLIANAIKKYGKDAFTYEILEADVFDEFLPDLEVAYIANHNTVAPHGYNLDSGGTHAIPSAETRKKLSERQKGEKHHFYRKKFSAKHRRNLSEAQRDKTLSADHRRKISEAQRGEKNHNFGKSPSADHRRKISESNKNKKRSADHRRRYSEAQRGKTLSADHRRKISEALKGEKHPNYGKRHSVETRRKMLEAARRGENHPNFGKPPKNILPEYVPAHNFFLSLPPDMPLREKRKLLFDKFPDIKKHTIYKWVCKWTSSAN